MPGGYTTAMTECSAHPQPGSNGPGEGGADSPAHPPVQVTLTEAILSAAADGVGEYVYVVDSDLRITYVSGSMLRDAEDLGVRSERMVGAPLREAIPLLSRQVEDDYRFVLATSQTLMTDEVLPVGGRQIVCNVRKIPVVQEGRVTHIVTVVQDVSDHRTAQERTMVQRDLAQALLTVETQEDAAKLCLGAAMEISGLMGGGVYLVDEATGDLHLVCQTGFSEEFVRDVEHVAASDPRAQLVMSGSPHYGLSSLASVTTAEEPIRAEGLKYVAVLPVRHAGRVVGCLNLAAYSRAEVPADARHALETVAAQLGGIIGRFRAQARERRSEARFRTAFESAGFGMLLFEGADPLTADRMTNPALQQMLGYTADEIRVMPLEALECPDGVDAARARMRETVEGSGARHRAEKQLVRKDGTTLWGDVAVNAVRAEDGSLDFALAVVNDISERKMTEQDLRESRQRLELALGAGDMALWTLDLKTDRFGHEARLAELLRYDPQGVEWTVQWTMDNIAEADRASVAAGVSQHVRGETPAYDAEYRMLCGDGVWRWVRSRGRVVEWDAAGAPVRMAGVIQDITERKEAEARSRQLEIQNEKLESLGVLAGGIAHDLGNFLQGILHNATILGDAAGDDPSAEEALVNMRSATIAAARLSDELLVYAGRREMAVERVDLAILAREVIGLLRASVSKKAVFECRLPERSLPVVGDPAQLRQVLLNLVINASDALQDQEGYIVVEVAATQIDGRTLRDAYSPATPPVGPCVLLRVSDTGCGMDTATRTSMFDPFFTTKESGRGLGLAAVLGIVQKHSAALRVDTEPGRGTTVELFFPASTADETAPDDEARAESTAPRPTGDVTVLVVDDEPAVRESTRVLLQRAGYRVLTASDGVAAHETACDPSAHVGIVLMDLRMPRLSGEESAAKIRQLRPDLPIIAVSAFSATDIAGSLGDQGFVGAIRKPYVIGDLLIKMGEVLEQRSSH